MTFQNLIKISRPRFWLYTTGPYILGIAAAATHFTPRINLIVVFFLLYFLFFSNIFLYGVNDIFDEDTDLYNSKKDSWEHRLLSKEKRGLLFFVGISVLLSAVGLFLLKPVQYPYFLLFIALSYFYSAPPFRFKSKPFVDSISNFLYVLPGIIGYLQFSQKFPSVYVIVGGWLWVWGMHLYSAIPDIAPDKKAGLRTSAVLLGQKRSLWLCVGLWVFASLALLTVGNLGWFKYTGWLYPVVCLYVLSKPEILVSKVYKFFPVINAVYGFLLYLIIAMHK